MSLETITIEAHRTAPNLEEVKHMAVEERKRVLLEESNRLDTVLELQSQEREILIVEKQVALRLMDHEEVKENLRKAKFADEQQETKAKASIIKKFIQNHGKKTALIAGGAVVLSAAAVKISQKHETTPTETSKTKTETPKNKLEALIDEEPRIEEIVSKIDRPFFNKLDTAGQVVYLSQIADTAERRKHPGAWMMVDKNEAKLYVIGEDGKFLKEISVLLGQVIGNEENRVTSTKNPGEFGTTPGGGYRAGEEGITESDWKKYGAAIRIYTNDDQNILLHPLLPENTEEQLKQLQSQNPKEHRVTNGCIRLVMGDLEYVTTVFREGSMVYILPDNEGETGEKRMVLDPKTLYIWDVTSKNFLNSEGKRLLTHVQNYDKVVKM